MGKTSNQPNAESEILAKLEYLEKKIKESEATQKRIKSISFKGALLVFALLSLFIYRLYDYFAHYDYEKVMEEVMVDAKGIIQPEVDLFLRELHTELLPTFFDHLMVRFRESTPEIKNSAFKLASNLESELRERAEERLMRSLITSIEHSGEEIENIFPGFSAEDLEKHIGKSIDYYVEKLHDSLEERIALSASSLSDLKSTVEVIGKTLNSELAPKTSSEAEDQLLDALLDLVVYEIKPKVGMELAVE